MTKEELIEAIEIKFSSVKYPGDNDQLPDIEREDIKKITQYIIINEF